MFAALGSALGAAAGIASAFRKKDNGPGLGGMVRRAKKLGLHPLAVLGSPIAGNFAVPTSGRDVGAGLGAAADALSGYADRSENRRLADEAARRLRRQDDMSAAEAKSRINLNNARIGEIAAAIKAATSHTLAAKQNSERNPDGPGSSLNLWGFDLHPGSGGGKPTAQRIQDEYGDPAEWAYGLPRGITDFAASLGIQSGQEARAIADFLDVYRSSKSSTSRSTAPDTGLYTP